MDEIVYMIAPIVEIVSIFLLGRVITSSLKPPHSKIITGLLLVAVVPAALLYLYSLNSVLTIPDTASNGKALFAASIQLFAVSVWLVVPLLFTLIAAALKKVLNPVLLYLLYSPVGILELGAVYWLLTS